VRISFFLKGTAVVHTASTGFNCPTVFRAPRSPSLKTSTGFYSPTVFRALGPPSRKTSTGFHNRTIFRPHPFSCTWSNVPVGPVLDATATVPLLLLWHLHHGEATLFLSHTATTARRHETPIGIIRSDFWWVLQWSHRCGCGFASRSRSSTARFQSKLSASTSGKEGSKEGPEHACCEHSTPSPSPA
jgi:hypothetical protein